MEKKNSVSGKNISGVMDNVKLMKELNEMDIFSKFKKDVGYEFRNHDGVIERRMVPPSNKIMENIENATLYKNWRLNNIQSRMKVENHRGQIANHKRRQISIKKREDGIKFMARHNLLKDEREAVETANIKYWTLHYKRLHWLFLIVIFL